MQRDGNSRNLVSYTKMSEIKIIECIMFRQWAFLAFNKPKSRMKTRKQQISFSGRRVWSLGLPT